jgi:hypothetical protein
VPSPDLHATCFIWTLSQGTCCIFWKQRNFCASGGPRGSERGGFEDKEREREKRRHVFINALFFKPQNASSYQKCPIIREEDVSIMRDHRSKEFVHPKSSPSMPPSPPSLNQHSKNNANEKLSCIEFPTLLTQSDVPVPRVKPRGMFMMEHP